MSARRTRPGRFPAFAGDTGFPSGAMADLGRRGCDWVAVLKPVHEVATRAGSGGWLVGDDWRAANGRGVVERLEHRVGEIGA
jgi:hypothetical protein